ncbi:hypothetical protein AB0L02_27575 [Streptomyces anulatus]|uniref:hypothetical protein n=1 Tax=Streptomyces anulatus TaxID=1892 RepID=UPI0034234626
MNAKRVSAAAGVILAAQKTKQTPAGIAAALEAAGLLQSPESAAELVALRERVTELETAAVRRPRPVTACEACGDLPEKWCPDCAACKAGCFGGHDGNSCTHPNTCWSAPSPVEDPHGSPYALGHDLPEDPCRPCGCPKRFDRHADGCPTLPEGGAL